jgi:AcrR family transcriptional regulator
VTVARKAGRPRDPLVHDAILRATAHLLGEGGYAKLSIDGVAQRAGVTRQSIYRRWPAKLPLVAELLHEVSEGAPLPDTGNVRDDLLALYRLYARNLLTPGGPIIPALIAESLLDAELATIMNRYTDERRALAMAIFERAIARGEIRADSDPGLLIDMISGFFWHRKLIRRAAIRYDQAERFVDILLDGIGVSRPPRDAARVPRARS